MAKLVSVKMLRWLSYVMIQWLYIKSW